MALQKGTNPGRRVTITAAADLAAYRFIGYTRQYAAADAKARGVTDDAHASGDTASIIVSGTVIVHSGGSFSVGAAVTSDANGKAVATDASTDAINGYAVTAATGANQEVLIQLV